MRLVLVTALVLSALSTFAPRPVCASGSCGIVPIKPIPPIGCKDLEPQCVCDQHGQNCHWTWVCVK
jgi:hypothetical protein